jgi:osmotically-inducible protein OsmY
MKATLFRRKRMQKSDQEIKSAVEGLLLRNSRVDEKEVRVEVRDSVVTLTGEVDSTLEKRNARRIAEDVEGVHHVVDNLSVKGFVKRTDEELVQDVKIRLQRDAFVENSPIEVYAQNGEIRLDGSVGTYHEKKAVEDVAWWTPGVIGVENLLLVSDEDFVDVSPLEVPNA